MIAYVLLIAINTLLDILTIMECILIFVGCIALYTLLIMFAPAILVLSLPSMCYQKYELKKSNEEKLKKFYEESEE